MLYCALCKRVSDLQCINNEQMM